jgi:hypothetical protein
MILIHTYWLSFLATITVHTNRSDLQNLQCVSLKKAELSNSNTLSNAKRQHGHFIKKPLSVKSQKSSHSFEWHYAISRVDPE